MEWNLLSSWQSHWSVRYHNETRSGSKGQGRNLSTENIRRLQDTAVPASPSGDLLADNMKRREVNQVGYLRRMRSPRLSRLLFLLLLLLSSSPSLLIAFICNVQFASSSSPK